MHHVKRILAIGLFLTGMLLLFAVNRRIVSNYNNRLRHANSIVFCINEYYVENNKMPHSLNEIEDRICSLASPFEGNLTLDNAENSVVLREKEPRSVNLFQKRAIKIVVGSYSK